MICGREGSLFERLAPCVPAILQRIISRNPDVVSIVSIGIHGETLFEERTYLISAYRVLDPHRIKRKDKKEK